MKSTQLYDFTLSANGSQVILADANFYKVLTSTGDLQITRDGGSTVKPMRAGRGEREVPFQRLTIKDISGATNSGTIVVGDSNFIDDTIILSSAINVRPEPITGFFNSAATLAAGTAEQIFSAASNTGGAIILSAYASIYEATAITHFAGIFAKATAPTTTSDAAAEPIMPVINFNFASAYMSKGELWNPQFISAGKGLFYIDETATPANAYTRRGCRYKLL